MSDQDNKNTNTDDHNNEDELIPDNFTDEIDPATFANNFFKNNSKSKDDRYKLVKSEEDHKKLEIPSSSNQQLVTPSVSENGPENRPEPNTPEHTPSKNGSEKKTEPNTGGSPENQRGNNNLEVEPIYSDNKNKKEPEPKTNSLGEEKKSHVQNNEKSENKSPTPSIPSDENEDIPQENEENQNPEMPEKQTDNQNQNPENISKNEKEDSENLDNQDDNLPDYKKINQDKDFYSNSETEKKARLISYLVSKFGSENSNQKILAAFNYLQNEKGILHKALSNSDLSDSELLMEKLRNAKNEKEVQQILSHISKNGKNTTLNDIINSYFQEKLNSLKNEKLWEIIKQTENEEMINQVLNILEKRIAKRPNTLTGKDNNTEAIQDLAKKGAFHDMIGGQDSTPFTKIDDQPTVIPKENNNTENQFQEEPEPNENEGDATPSNNQSANNQQLSKNQAKPQAPKDKSNSEEEEKKKESPVEKAEDVVKEVAKSAIKELIFQIFFVPPVCFYTWVTILITGIVICFFMATSIVADCIINLKVFESQCTSLTTAIADDVKKSVLSSLGLSGAELDERMSNKKTEPTKTPTEQAQNNSGVPNPSQ